MEGVSVKEFLYTCPVSLKEIARRSGLNYHQIRNYSTGLRCPDSAKLKLIRMAVANIAIELLKTKINEPEKRNHSRSRLEAKPV
jgi:hypothetical protein